MKRYGAGDRDSLAGQISAAMGSMSLRGRLRSGKADLLIAGKPGIMPELTGLIPELATLAQSAEQTLRKRQVKGSNPLGGLIDIGRPQQLPVGAFAVSSACCWWQGLAARSRIWDRMQENPLGFRYRMRHYRHRYG